MTRNPFPKLVLIAVLSLTSPSVARAAEEPSDVTPRFAGVAVVDQLRAVEIAGVLILRGRVADRVAAEAVGLHARTLGYTRVANLIQTVDHNDAQLIRAAERELSAHRALDGCRFSVASDRGVVRVGGTVRHELQKDVALQVLRSIDGIQRIEVDLKRF